ncbi:UDP-N-acetylmuramoylalanine--D-glutamate ligase [Deinococcus piscis]|uniref:UDP-N-acetylmuramoylalanine--D-glutamate ligase n=1 Tax=Deinococcus piscis TaxID=394230 RepID=A0ABQ3K945_9DEIO|nr:UDP-N-acetylmuramoyl-L-alanine--D-glutamate ligase [Deinococcus piscis]GHG08901.1 UDP-N-acetylmuramoylalanine--D-glutamate ligase [Deinococcus piscis]
MTDRTPPTSSHPHSAPPWLIYGLGRSGRGVARFLHAEGLQAEWLDARPGPEDHALMQELGFAPGAVDRPYRTVVAAPGVPIDHPDLLALAAQGAEIIGEVALAARQRPSVMLVGVTGTAGKGGTTTLTAQLLRACGVAALEGGNIDPPLLDVIDRCEAAVVELSSFQLERIAATRFPVAVMTNLGVDHLDRHGSVKSYHAAKLHIADGQEPGDLLLLPPADTLSGEHLRPLLARPQVRHFEPHRIALADGTPVLDAADLPAGVHPTNAAAAVLAAEAALGKLGQRVPDLSGTLAQGLRQARPLGGRFEEVGRWREVRFIEDSIATRTIAVQSALEQARPPVVWVVGGRDKGAELAPLRDAAQGRVRHVIAYGEDGPRFAQELGFPQTTVAAQDGQAAMTEVVAQAVRHLPEGQGTVLLAPIGTSFDLFANYQERGAAFRAAVQTWISGQEEQA